MHQVSVQATILVQRFEAGKQLQLLIGELLAAYDIPSSLSRCKDRFLDFACEEVWRAFLAATDFLALLICQQFAATVLRLESGDFLSQLLLGVDHVVRLPPVW